MKMIFKKFKTIDAKISKLENQKKKIDNELLELKKEKLSLSTEEILGILKNTVWTCYIKSIKYIELELSSDNENTNLFKYFKDINIRISLTDKVAIESIGYCSRDIKTIKLYLFDIEDLIKFIVEYKFKIICNENSTGLLLTQYNIFRIFINKCKEYVINLDRIREFEYEIASKNSLLEIKEFLEGKSSM